MRLFISWSGEFSRKVAERLSVWIPTIIQTVDVFYSPDDIAKGENWGNRLSEELEQSNFGIVCLTPENVLAPWVHFEAGALSKAANSRVSAIMLGVTPSEVKGPLARLQNTAFEREDFYRLFQSINNSSDTPLKTEILNNSFNNSWKMLMDDIDPIIKDYTSPAPTLKVENDKQEERSSDSEALQEILRLVRNLDSSKKAPISSSVSPYSRFLNDSFGDPDDDVTVRLYGSKDSLAEAIPLIRMYISPGSEGPYIEPPSVNGRYAYACTIQVPGGWLRTFKRSMDLYAPDIDVLL